MSKCIDLPRCDVWVTLTQAADNSVMTIAGYILQYGISTILLRTFVHREIEYQVGVSILYLAVHTLLDLTC